MTRTLKLASLALLLIVGGTSLAAAQSLAASHWPTYRFELVDQTIHTGRNVPVSVRLIQASTGKAVTTGTITEQKLEMVMDGMAPMPAQVKALPPDTNGNYQFASDVTMPGDWELDLSATVPGQQDPIHGTLKFQVVK